MILSHKYKFFFLRSRRVGGSSILYGLGKQCGEDDIVNSPDTAIGRSNGLHGTNYKSVKKNFHIIDPSLYDPDNPNFVGASPRVHITPSELQYTFPKEWETYSRIGAVRNPYDMVYSMWAFRMVIRPDQPQRTFSEWVLNKEGYMINGRPGHKHKVLEFWFDHDTGLPIKYDFMIKYENLENDYKNVCEHFGIPYEPLVKLNTATRLDHEAIAKFRALYKIEKDGNVYPNKSYRKVYDDETREYVGNLYGKLIERYNYEF